MSTLCQKRSLSKIHHNSVINFWKNSRFLKRCDRLPSSIVNTGKWLAMYPKHIYIFVQVTIPRATLFLICSWKWFAMTKGSDIVLKFCTTWYDWPLIWPPGCSKASSSKPQITTIWSGSWKYEFQEKATERLQLSWSQVRMLCIVRYTYSVFELASIEKWHLYLVYCRKCMQFLVMNYIVALTGSARLISGSFNVIFSSLYCIPSWYSVVSLSQALIKPSCQKHFKPVFRAPWYS